MTDAPAPPRSAGDVGWGILATGGIAGLFAGDLRGHGHRIAAVGSRTVSSAEAFAEQFGVARAHGSYDDLVADPAVDIVYVATPHSLHAENALIAIDHGKHVLVEKPFTVTAAQARTVATAAREKGVLAMEAMWTRFLPHMEFVRSVVAEGRLGELRFLQADHAQRLQVGPTHRLNDPALGGGALLDLGVYPIAFAHDLLGAPVEINAIGTLSTTGVDRCVATMLRHQNGAVSTSYSSMEARGPNVAMVLGTEGRLEIESVWYAPAVVTVRDGNGTVAARFEQPVTGRGMQFQAAEAERLVAAGETSSPLMPPEESVAVMETMDAVRDLVGVHFPGE
jgi:predicted dehydrogenase